MFGEFNFKLVLLLSFVVSFCGMTYIGYSDAIENLRSVDEIRTIGKYVTVTVPALHDQSHPVILRYTCGSAKLAYMYADGDTPSVDDTQFASAQTKPQMLGKIESRTGTLVAGISAANLWQYSKSLLPHESS